MNSLVRHATQEDLSTIADFNVAMALETENKVLDATTVLKGAGNLLSHPELGFYLVAESEGELAACLMVTFEWSDWRNGFFWWIQSVYVAPQHRCKGLYRKMYGRVKQLAKEKANICGLRLYVEKQNVHAQTTYQTLGMCETDYLLFEEVLK